MRPPRLWGAMGPACHSYSTRSSDYYVEQHGLRVRTRVVVTHCHESWGTNVCKFLVTLLLTLFSCKNCAACRIVGPHVCIYIRPALSSWTGLAWSRPPCPALSPITSKTGRHCGPQPVRIQQSPPCHGCNSPISHQTSVPCSYHSTSIPSAPQMCRCSSRPWPHGEVK